jgi:prepilin-type N-terminal cleavage/methylation domain-containing protein
MKKFRYNRGFTLIEVMIVVCIIGILASMAIPRYFAVVTKNKQAEAKLVLKQIYTNERAYRMQGLGYWIPAGAANMTTPTAFDRIWVEIMPPARYTYTITGDANSFTATATSGILDDDDPVDTWTINDAGNLICTSDDSQL